ncbi:MAG: Rieske (2Fe-2S) protein [Parachlamydiales bacterium]|jgi:nitrite reductase/ring-hydroxylating ferredoxin subunit
MGRKIARCEDIAPGKKTIASLEDGREIVIFNCDGEFYAIENVCPHMGGPLGEGEMDGCTVVCPWHGWQFDIKSGSCINMPGENAKKIRISVKDGFVCLDG